MWPRFLCLTSQNECDRGGRCHFVNDFRTISVQIYIYVCVHAAGTPFGPVAPSLAVELERKQKALGKT